MANLLQRGMNMLNKVLSSAAGGMVVYQRGDDRTSPFSATFGRSEFQAETANSISLEHTDRDFIFSAAHLILGGKLVAPEKGDRITVVGLDNADDQVFEVLAPGGAQVYRNCDPQGFMIRVHGKRIE